MIEKQKEKESPCKTCIYAVKWPLYKAKPIYCKKIIVDTEPRKECKKWKKGGE